jgi:ribosomal protein L7/L12
MDRPDETGFNDLTRSQYEELRQCLKQQSRAEALGRCRMMFPAIGSAAAEALITAVEQATCPPMSDEALDAELARLLAAGDKITAIKLLREAHPHLGLAEAKSIVESGRYSAPPTKSVSPAAPIEGEILSLLRESRKIEAIRRYREQQGGGLKEAKEAVEALAARHGIVSKSGSCFVATAVFADANAPEVAALRHWRDTRLMHSQGGLLFVRLYEVIGPRLAQVVLRQPWLRRWLRPLLAGIAHRVR